MALPIAPPFAPMEARSERELPAPGGVLYEPKWDGFRCIAFREGNELFLQSKSGQPLARYFPEIADALQSLSATAFVLDGELVVPVSDRLDFDQLLQRIHPAASRVKMLAQTFPASYLIFDLLVDEHGRENWKLPLRERRAKLESFARHFIGANILRLSPATQEPSIVERWLKVVGGALDGIIAKDLDSPYASGERTAAVKVKRMRTADCVIGGYRKSKDGKAIGSLLLGLYEDDGTLDYVGFTSGFSASEKMSLLKQLQAIRGISAFTGRSPGGPSRWSHGMESEWFPVEPKLVLEVEFDHVSGGRFRHGTRPLRFRPDKAPRQCTMDQLQQPRGQSPFTLAVAD
ncbi:MAG: ATP-dependent DNA ligase [Candidatus Eremiobacteraeota bacterium]|nr:ATP-dependent DNA ligase [Candidatus Eremiobacteraeota bacterium]